MVIFTLVSLVIGAITLLLIDRNVRKEGAKYIVDIDDAPEVDAILVLGAYVDPKGNLCNMLEDRMKYGLELYNKNKSSKMLLSGDHGKNSYDEVNAMKKFAEERGVNKENIFLDHAGFSTYESMYRARDIFKAKKILIVTQEYHLMRAVYIARKLGIEAYGVASDPRDYYGIEYYKKREMVARVKDFLMVNVVKPKPTYLGEAIPVSGDGRVTHDKN